MSIHERLRRHSYDLVVFMPFKGQVLTVNIWASSEGLAKSRVVSELGGQGYVQILMCERMQTDKSSASVKVV